MDQTIAGALSTGTLPASAKYNMGYVTKLHVLKWDGQSLKDETVILRDKDKAILDPPPILSLGMLYVVHTVELALVEAVEWEAKEQVCGRLTAVMYG